MFRKPFPLSLSKTRTRLITVRRLGSKRAYHVMHLPSICTSSHVIYWRLKTWDYIPIRSWTITNTMRHCWGRSCDRDVVYKCSDLLSYLLINSSLFLCVLHLYVYLSSLSVPSFCSPSYPSNISALSIIIRSCTF